VRAAPPFQITVECFAHWRAAVMLFAGAACLCVFAWAMAAHERGFGVATVVVALIGTVLVSATAVVSAWRLRATSLRWDGQLWHWGPASTRGAEPTSGTVAVACDLGAWLLLRLAPSAAATRWAGTAHRWLPIQRTGHELHWHALRCTVYSPRPSPSHLLPPRKDPTPE
jgi:hypothetical protein